MIATVEALEQAVQNLPAADFAQFRRWFAAFNAKQWDAQMEADADLGKLDALAHEALDDYRNGKATAL